MAQPSTEDKPPAIKEEEIIAVLFTGTEVRLKEVMSQVNGLSADFFVSLIVDAEFKQLDRLESVKLHVQCQEILEEDDRKKIEVRLQQARLLLVPLLSRNVAARLALGLTDTLAPAVIFRALISKLPVLAIADGARAEEVDLEIPMVRPSPSSIKNIMNGYLNTWRHWGVEFIEVGEIIDRVKTQAKPAGIEPRPLTTTERPPAKRPIITRDDILEIKRRGETKIKLSKDAIITSLALDYASEEGIEIIDQ